MGQILSSVNCKMCKFFWPSRNSGQLFHTCRKGSNFAVWFLRRTIARDEERWGLIEEALRRRISDSDGVDDWWLMIEYPQVFDPRLPMCHPSGVDSDGFEENQPWHVLRQSTASEATQESMAAAATNTSPSTPVQTSSTWRSTWTSLQVPPPSYR